MNNHLNEPGAVFCTACGDRLTSDSELLRPVSPTSSTPKPPTTAKRPWLIGISAIIAFASLSVALATGLFESEAGATEYTTSAQGVVGGPDSGNETTRPADTESSEYTTTSPEPINSTASLVNSLAGEWILPCEGWGSQTCGDLVLEPNQRAFFYNDGHRIYRQWNVKSSSTTGGKHNLVLEGSQLNETWTATIISVTDDQFVIEENDTRALQTWFRRGAAVISGFTENSLAVESLQVGDAIRSISGISVIDSDDIRPALAGIAGGARIPLKIQRGGQILNVSVTTSILPDGRAGLGIFVPPGARGDAAPGSHPRTTWYAWGEVPMRVGPHQYNARILTVPEGGIVHSRR